MESIAGRTSTECFRSPRMMVAIRWTIRRILFPLAALTIGVVVADFLLAFVVYVPEVQGFNRKLYSAWPKTAHPREVHYLNLIVESEPDGFRFEHRLNIYGFRDRDFTVRRRGAKRRVLVVGDSFVEGYGAREREDMPSVLESLSQRQPVDCMNLGILGNGLAEYAMVIRDATPVFRPADVLLVFYANDFTCRPFDAGLNQPTSAKIRRSYSPRINWTVSRFRANESIATAFSREDCRLYSAVPSPYNPLSDKVPLPTIDPSLLDAMQRGAINPTLALGVRRWMQKALTQPEPHDADWVRQHLIWASDYCRRHGAMLSVLYVPCSFAVHPRYLKSFDRIEGFEQEYAQAWSGEEYRVQQRHLSAMCSELSIPFRDVTDDFIAAESAGARLYWEIDAHCNATGYRRLAEQAASLLDLPTNSVERHRGSMLR